MAKAQVQLRSDVPIDPSQIGQREGEGEFDYVKRRLIEERGYRASIAALAGVGMTGIVRILAPNSTHNPRVSTVRRLYDVVLGLEKGDIVRTPIGPIGRPPTNSQTT